MTKNPAGVLTASMVIIGMRQISKEAEDINELFAGIVNAFAESDASRTAELAEGEFQCSVWQGEDQKEWVLGFSKKWELASINFHHPAGLFGFEYKISDDGADDQEQVYALTSQDIFLLWDRLDSLLHGALAKFPFLYGAMQVYAEAARRAGAG